MVSFQCDGCADTVKKPQLDKHRNRCWAPFTCLDCSTTFHGTDYKSHTSCISEAEKYEKTVYKGKRTTPGHNGNNAAKNSYQQRQAPAPTFTEAPPPDISSEAPAATPTSSVHPSRARMVDRASSSVATQIAHGTTGGRRNMPGGPGGFPSLHPPTSAPLASTSQQRPSKKTKMTGTNGFTPEAGGTMRSWGGTPDVEEQPAKDKTEASGKVADAAAAPAAAKAEEESKKKSSSSSKKSKKRKAEASVDVEEKKDDEDGSKEAAANTSIASASAASFPDRKLAKRLKKALAALPTPSSDSSSTTLTLADLVKTLESSTKKAGVEEVLKGLKVKWVSVAGAEGEERGGGCWAIDV